MGKTAKKAARAAANDMAARDAANASRRAQANILLSEYNTLRDQLAALDQQASELISEGVTRSDLTGLIGRISSCVLASDTAVSDALNSLASADQRLTFKKKQHADQKRKEEAALALEKQRLNYAIVAAERMPVSQPVQSAQQYTPPMNYSVPIQNQSVVDDFADLL